MGGRTAERTAEPARRRALALSLVVAAPVLWVPGGFTRFGPATLLLVAAAALVAATVPAVGRLPRRLVLVGVAWCTALALAAVLGDTPLASLLGRWPRYEGLPVLLLYGAAAWVGARTLDRDAAGTRRLTSTVGALAIVLAVASLLDLLGLDLVSPGGAGGLARSGSLLGNATDQGAVAMMAALVVAAPAFVRRRPADVVALVAALVTVAISGSRTALALTVLGLLVTGAGVRPGRRPRTGLHTGPNTEPNAGPPARASDRRRWAGAAAGLVALVAATLAVPTTRERLMGLGTGRGRLEQWGLTLDLVRDHLLLGLGPNRYLDVFPAYESASFVRFTGSSRLADSPHSLALQVLVAGGLVLAAVSLVGLTLVALRCRDALRDRPATAPAALAAAAYLGLLSINPTSAGPTCLAALLLGSVVAVAPTARGGAQPARLPVRAASAVAVVVLLAAVAGDVRLQQGIDAADEHRPRVARTAIDNVRALRPWDADAALLGAQALAQEATTGSGNAAEAASAARALARTALRRTPDSPDALVALGVAHLARGELEAALASLDRAVALAPRRPDGYVQRGIARVGLGDLDGARADLAVAQRIAPGSPVVRRLLRRVEQQARRRAPDTAGATDE